MGSGLSVYFNFELAGHLSVEYKCPRGDAEN